MDKTFDIVTHCWICIIWQTKPSSLVLSKYIVNVNVYVNYYYISCKYFGGVIIINKIIYEIIIIIHFINTYGYLKLSFNKFLCLFKILSLIVIIININNMIKKVFNIKNYIELYFFLTKPLSLKKYYN